MMAWVLCACAVPMLIDNPHHVQVTLSTAPASTARQTVSTVTGLVLDGQSVPVPADLLMPPGEQLPLRRRQVLEEEPDGNTLQVTLAPSATNVLTLRVTSQASAHTSA